MSWRGHLPFQIGTNGDDDIVGNDTFNVLFGLGGDDTMTGGSHRDFIFGGNGNDEIFGNDGNDILIGGRGSDAIFGGEGNDILIGGSGNDSLEGNFGNDRYEMGAGNDVAQCVVTGSVAADFIRERADFDQIIALAQGAYDQTIIDVDLGGAFAEGNPDGNPTAEYFVDFTIGEDVLNIQSFIPWLFIITSLGVLGELEDLNDDGLVNEADVLLKLIDSFLSNTMTFGEAKDLDLIPENVELYMEENGLDDDDCVFLANQIGADEIFGFSDVDPMTFKENLFAVFDFGLTPDDFAAFNLALEDIQAVGQAHGVEFDLTGFV